MNGSFALPSKHLKHWSYQRIWLNYSFWAFLVFPLLLLVSFSPKALLVFKQASANTIVIIVIGGVLFAIGQICFSKALETIGLGLGFLINIGIGTALGSFIPLIILHPSQVNTPQGMTIIIGVLLILTGLFISYLAGKKRDGEISVINASKQNYKIGVALASLAGLFSAGQNITFSYTHLLQVNALNLGISPLMSANIIWPAFLLATFIPYAAYMVYLSYRNSDTNKKFKSSSYYLATIVMGAFWYFSLILYSAASLKIGKLGPVIGWPLFMVCIILTAHLWGVKQGEWAGASKGVKYLAKAGIIFFVLSILILAYATSLSM